MTELRLEWIEAGCFNTQKLVPSMTLPKVQMLRIGRDPSRCDIVLADGSVSGLHVEVGYHPDTHSFYVQNLRESNPPVINGQPLVTGRVALQAENTIQLGNVKLKAIANLPLPAVPLPNTDHLPQAAVPPTEVLSAPHSARKEGYLPPAVPSADLPQDRLDTPSPSTSPARSLGLIAGGLGLMLGLFLLAWPNISGFLGIGRGQVISDSSDLDPSLSDDESPSSEANEAPFTKADMVLYAHASGLFTLAIPQDWEFLDNSQAGEIVIQGWHHPRVNSYAIVRIFATGNELSRSQLEALGADMVDELFGELPEFQRGTPIVQSDQSVQVPWQAKEGLETLVAFTVVRQEGPLLSVLSVWLPDTLSDFDGWLNALAGMIESYRLNPDIKIP